MSKVVDQPISSRRPAEPSSPQDMPAQQTPVPPAVSPLPERTLPRGRVLLILLVLTLFGGFLRFAWIDRPTCWNDEAHVFRRITGSFQIMVDQLRNDGFGPLHYELYWAMAHWKAPTLQRLLDGLIHWNLTAADFWSGDPAAMTPFWMRLVPALAGTLMIPAMYFLARQFCSRRTSLVVSAFTACSAFLMVYSHDAKMYMHLWLFCALSMGAMLWWLRTGLRVAWLAWVAASLVVGGLHPPGLLVIALQPLILLTHRGLYRTDAFSFGWKLFGIVDWRKLVLYAIGTTIILSGPGVHYRFFSRWGQQVEEDWRNAGLGWLPPILANRSGPEMGLFVASDYLCSWEWPRLSYDADKQPPKPEPGNSAKVQQFISQGFSGMLQGFHIDPRVMTGLMSAVVIAFVAAAMGILPWSRRWRGETLDDPPTEAWWRTVLWLGIWLVLPAYAFYCASVDNYAGPADWFRSAHWFVRATAEALPGNRVTVIYGSHPALITTGVMIVLGGLFLLSRFIPALVAAASGLAALSLLGLAVWQSGLFSLALGGLKVLLTGIYNPRSTSEAIAALGEWWRIPRAFGHRLLALILDPRTLVVAMCIVPALAWHYCGQGARQRMIRLLQLLAVIAAICGLCWGIQLGFRRWDSSDHGPVWMSRYMGMIWPAFAIAICALIARLPSRPLRWMVISILLATNLAQAYGRMFAGSEPCLDLMMRDIVAADEASSPVLTYIQEFDRRTPQSAHPAGGTVENRPGKYYAAITTGRLFEDRTPAYFLSKGRTTELLNLRRIRKYTAPSDLALDVQQASSAGRVIVWDRVLERPYKPESDGVLAALGAGWAKAGEEYHPVRYHWNWSSLYIWRRREYVKDPAATPPMTAAPATQPAEDKTDLPAAPPPRRRGPQAGQRGPATAQRAAESARESTRPAGARRAAGPSTRPARPSRRDRVRPAAPATPVAVPPVDQPKDPVAAPASQPAEAPLAPTTAPSN